MAQLHGGMLPAICDLLESTVRTFGMRAFIYHDPIATECFSRGFSSAMSGMEAWSPQLTNGSQNGDPLVAWLQPQSQISLH